MALEPYDPSMCCKGCYEKATIMVMMDRLDEIKTDMAEGDYLRLCDKFKTKFENTASCSDDKIRLENDDDEEIIVEPYYVGDTQYYVNRETWVLEPTLRVFDANFDVLSGWRFVADNLGYYVIINKEGVRTRVRYGELGTGL